MQRIFLLRREYFKVEATTAFCGYFSNFLYLICRLTLLGFWRRRLKTGTALLSLAMTRSRCRRRRSCRGRRRREHGGGTWEEERRAHACTRRPFLRFRWAGIPHCGRIALALPVWGRHQRLGFSLRPRQIHNTAKAAWELVSKRVLFIIRFIHSFDFAKLGKKSLYIYRMYIVTCACM